MFIKLSDQLINLDLVKEVSEVIPFLDHPDHTQIGKSHWYFDDEEAYNHWLDISVNGSEGQREYSVHYTFEVHYIGEKYPKYISHHDKVKLESARDKFATLLNNNQPVINTIEI